MKIFVTLNILYFFLTVLMIFITLEITKKILKKINKEKSFTSKWNLLKLCQNDLLNKI